MPCKSDPRGPLEVSQLFTRPMTAADRVRANNFMRAYEAWERNLAAWRGWWGGGAPYWVGPRPTRPGAPPASPTITNTACRAAAQVGEAAIFAALQRDVSAKFTCTGTCRNGQVCVKKFKRRKGDGYSLTKGLTYCNFTVYGDCVCPGDDIEVPGLIEP